MCVLSRFSHVWLFVTLWTGGSSVHGILQARILEWVAISSSRGSSPARDWTHVSQVSCIGGFFTTSATWEAWKAYAHAHRASLVAQMVKKPPAMQETWVQSLGQEDPLEKGMATHSSILSGEPHRQRILAGYSPWGRKRVGHDLATEQQQQQQYIYVHSHPLPLGFPLSPPLSLHPPRSSQSTELSPLCHAAGMLTFILPMVVYLY